MRKGGFCLVAASLLAATPASARVVIDGTPEFEAHVYACFEMITGVGGRPAEILDGLQISGNEHVIQENEGTGSTTYTNPAAATAPAFGGTGAGSGSTIDWDPDFPFVYADGVERDFCAALFHEMAHAIDGDRGTRPTGVDPASGVRRSEIGPNGATTLENEYRDAKGLEQRRLYGGNPLPPGSIIN